MKKFTKIATAGMLAIALALPIVSLAKDNHGAAVKAVAKLKGENHGAKVNAVAKLKDKNIKAAAGTVAAISSSTTSFTLLAHNQNTFMVNAFNATIVNEFGQTVPFSSIKVNDKAAVKGSISGTTITASKIIITPANTHVAVGRGQVSAVNGSNFTVQMTSHGIVTFFNVTTDSNTAFKKGDVTTTIASVQVGSKVEVHGLWDEIQNVLKAVKVKIK